MSLFGKKKFFYSIKIELFYRDAVLAGRESCTTSQKRLIPKQNQVLLSIDHFFCHAAIDDKILAGDKARFF
jgi:hypothetical protein